MSKIELFEHERALAYNQFVATWIPNYYSFLDAVPKILREVTPKKILVAGCGTGNEIVRFLQQDEQWEVTGVDPSPEMIVQAKEQLKDFPNVRLIEGVVADLDTDQKYQAATLLLVLHFLEDNGDKLRTLQDIAERLVPGAPFVMLDITGDRIQLADNLKILKYLLPEGIDAAQIEERLQRIQNDLFAVSEHRIAALFEESGFEAPVRFFQSSIYMGWISKKK